MRDGRAGAFAPAVASDPSAAPSHVPSGAHRPTQSSPARSGATRRSGGSVPVPDPAVRPCPGGDHHVRAVVRVPAHRSAEPDHAPGRPLRRAWVVMIERRIIIPGAIVQGITGRASRSSSRVAGRTSRARRSAGSRRHRPLPHRDRLRDLRPGQGRGEDGRTHQGMAGGPPPGAPAGPPPDLVETAARAPARRDDPDCPARVDRHPHGGPSVNLMPSCRTSDSLMVWGVICRSTVSPRSLASLYWGTASGENGWRRRPNQPRLRAGVDVGMMS